MLVSHVQMDAAMCAPPPCSCPARPPATASYQTAISVDAPLRFIHLTRRNAIADDEDEGGLPVSTVILKRAADVSTGSPTPDHQV